MYDKFQGCIVDVQAATMIIEQPWSKTLHYVHTLNVSHDAIHEVSFMECKVSH